MPKRLPLALGALAVIFVCAGSARAAITSKNLGAIWFVGDSITQSNADGDGSGSPRKSLYDKLNAGGYTFTYTGHSTSNLDGLPNNDNYRYHSGVSGSVIGSDFTDDNGNQRRGHTQNLSTWWTSGRLGTVKPNVILIMLGTNDIYFPINAASAPARLDSYIDAIFALPGVGNPSVFVATIPPDRAPDKMPSVAQRVLDFNAALPAVVNGLKAEGKDVTLVDQFTPLNANFNSLMVVDNVLNLHPNAAGNNVMAQQWFNAIEARAVPEPGSATLVGAAIAFLFRRLRRA